MKYFIFLLLPLLLLGEVEDNENNLVEIKDTSGLSDVQVREVAAKNDAKQSQKIDIKEVFEATDSKGKVDIKQIQVPWEELTPRTNGYDWVRTKGGEWFKGEIKALYDDKLEFDSDEVGLYTFKLKDISHIKSHYIISVNIEKVATFSGILRLKDDKLTIIQGDTKYEFSRSQIVSFAPVGELERNLWSGKITVSLDKRSGNKNQFDYTAQLNLKRRTDSTRLNLDYLGRASQVNNEQTANDHRINEKYDIYISRNFFWTPLFSEYYQDKFQNINSQITAGVGIGYTIINSSKIEWDVSGGPAFMQVNYITVKANEDTTSRSPSAELSTKLEYELTDISDLKCDLKLNLTDKKSGKYKHHMVVKLENEITSWLDIDITFVWDHTAQPTEASDGTLPYKNDYQMLLGLGVEF